MKKLAKIQVLIVLTLIILMSLSCQDDVSLPEDVISTFLEAASYADIDSMKAVCAGKMSDELQRDEQAITKLVYFERQKSLELNEGEENQLDNTQKTSRFAFDFTIMKEQTKIDPQERAEVWVILTRKNVSITRSFDLVWADGKWLIENYTNQVGG